tara:strand:- start:1448 stop:1621 length:174 start_codon:yes stop_codon:yes gene_type:complete
MQHLPLNQLPYHPLLAKAKEMEASQAEYPYTTVKELKETNKILWWSLFIVSSIGFMF